MNKYVNGYLPKIEYWKGRMNKAIENGDVRMIELSAVKLKYFTQRQAEVYGNNVIAGVDFSESLNLLKSL